MTFSLVEVVGATMVSSSTNFIVTSSIVDSARLRKVTFTRIFSPGFGLSGIVSIDSTLKTDSLPRILTLKVGSSSRITPYFSVS